MSIVYDSRTGLEKALEDQRLTVMVLSGSPSSDAGKIYDRITQVIDAPFRKAFLITSLEVLLPSERSEWFGGDMERFAVIGGEERKVVTRGPASDLMLGNGLHPSTLAIRSAFAKGDAA